MFRPPRSARRLTDGVSVSDRQALVPGLAPLTLLDAAGRGRESATGGGSFRNDFEAQTVAEIVERLMCQTEEDGLGTTGKETPGLPASSIGIICLCASRPRVTPPSVLHSESAYVVSGAGAPGYTRQPQTRGLTSRVMSSWSIACSILLVCRRLRSLLCHRDRDTCVRAPGVFL